VPKARPVVANATPLIALATIGQLDLLRRLYTNVTIPGAVRAEVEAGGRGSPGYEETITSRWITVARVRDRRRVLYFPDLDLGEAEVLALAEEMRARPVLLDERLARQHAERLGLTITGTLGILLRAKARGYVRTIRSHVKALQEAGFRLGDEVIDTLLKLAREAS
jgi:predicted nucleic acid-binding protein